MTIPYLSLLETCFLDTHSLNCVCCVCVCCVCVCVLCVCVCCVCVVCVCCVCVCCVCCVCVCCVCVCCVCVCVLCVCVYMYFSWGHYMYSMLMSVQDDVCKLSTMFIRFPSVWVCLKGVSLRAADWIHRSCCCTLLLPGCHVHAALLLCETAITCLSLYKHMLLS